MIKTKNIRKIKIVVLISLIILTATAFVSCGGDKDINIDLIDLADYIASKIDLDEYIKMPSERMQNEYNITEENTAQAVIMESFNMHSEEKLILVEAVDKDKVKEIENTLKQRKVEVLKVLVDYDANPDNENQYHIVDSAKMLIKGNYIFWAIHSQNSEINNMIEEFIKDNN